MDGPTTPVATPPAPVRLPTYAALESLRGVAALAVVMFHSSFSSPAGPLKLFAVAGTAVDLFFVLSGFVMAHAYLQRIRGGLPLYPFFLVRLGRLYPLHLFMLLVWLAYLCGLHLLHRHGLGNDPFLIYDLREWSAHALLVQSLDTVPHELTWNYPDWSVSVEFWVYLLFFAMARRVLLEARPWPALGLSLIAYALLWAWGDSLLKTRDLGLLRGAGGFFLGVAVWSFLYGQRSRPIAAARFTARWASAAELAAGALTLLCLLKSPEGKGWQLALFGSFGLAVGLYSFQRGLLSRLLLAAPLRWLGQVSYSIYLVHALVIAVFMNVAKTLLHLPIADVRGAFGGVAPNVVSPYAWAINGLLVLTVLAISAGTYRWIEQPWRERFKRWSGIGQRKALQRDLAA